MAEVAAPKKRAILELINLVRFADVPYYSVDGNHTSLKSSSDDHLYRIIENECDNFRGYRGPAYDPYSKVSFVPHSYDNSTIRDYIEESLHRDTELMVGHWAADDIPYVGQVSRRDLPEGVRIFLGHYHNYRPSAEHDPTYIGSTEKTAWDQWDYPTGCAVYDSDTDEFTRIEIPTRPWVAIDTDAVDMVSTFTSTDITNKVARLSVYCTPQEYNLLDKVTVRSYVRDSSPIAFTMRRKNPLDAAEVKHEPSAGEDMVQEWSDYMDTAEVPRGVSRKKVTEIGIEHLNG